MVETKPLPRLDYGAWLRLEAESDARTEYLRGEIYAMGGAALRHGRIALNVGRRLDEATEGGPCRVYVSDTKVRIEAADAGFYPDVVVSSDPRDVGPLVLLYACLVIEVLSPSTAAYDRGLKFAAYRQLETLREYVIVEPDQIAVDVFRRGPEGTWTFRSYGEGEVVELESIGARVPVAQIYDRLPPVEAPAPDMLGASPTR
ncbi:MAG: hypothetical protein AMXMBFR64_63040 [Myxococcales bacterium]